jgi:hypothetical protein
MSEEEEDAEDGGRLPKGEECKKLQRKLLADLDDALARVRGEGRQVERLLENVRERVLELPRFQPGCWEER